MIHNHEKLDPKLSIVDNLFGARELASNFAPTAMREEQSSPQAARLARSLHEVLKLHFTGDETFIRDGELGTTQPEDQPVADVEVMLIVDGFEDLVDQRRVIRQEHLVGSRIS